MTEGKNGKADGSGFEQYVITDPESFLRNLARIAEAAGKAAAAWAKPREEGIAHDNFEPAAELTRTLSKVAEYWMSDPARALEAQTRLFASYMDIWSASIRRLSGESAPAPVKPDPRDRRFADPEWRDNAFFDFMKQVYLVTARWAGDLVEHSEGLDEATRDKARFYVRQVTAALSPSNFLVTNPTVLRETAQTHGENLIRGLSMLAEDIERGRGDLKLRQVDPDSFELGRNLAITPGKVVARSDLAEIIQYEPTTGTVLKRPLVIVPPWINKYYILDLRPEKSFIRWAIAQGHTVFVISWVNPDTRHARADWNAYFDRGIRLALDTATAITGEPQVNAIGYCVGGTLLAASLALMAARGDDRVASLTLFATQVDFTHAGDLKVFVDENQIAALEEAMNAAGYLEGNKMAMAFNMLRANELIWPYVIDNYMRGKSPSSFDLLYWNSNSTRMSAANHSFYLRQCYLENALAEGRMELGGRRVSLADVRMPIYNLATREDHIAPARSVFFGSRLFGGDVTFVLSGSGHIAGVVNPPEPGKYQYWTGGRPTGNYEDWLEKAEQTPGSWWPHWQQWILARDSAEVPARPVGGCKLAALAEAPGEYVRVRA